MMFKLIIQRVTRVLWPGAAEAGNVVSQSSAAVSTEAGTGSSAAESSPLELAFHKVRNVAPHKDMYCVSFRLPYSVCMFPPPAGSRSASTSAAHSAAAGTAEEEKAHVAVDSPLSLASDGVLSLSAAATSESSSVAKRAKLASAAD